MRLRAIERDFFGFFAGGRPAGPDMISWDRSPEAINGFEIGGGEITHER